MLGAGFVESVVGGFVGLSVYLAVSKNNLRVGNPGLWTGEQRRLTGTGADGAADTVDAPRLSSGR